MMRVGFLVWNPFQVYQFESIARHVDEPVYLLREKKDIDLNRFFGREFLSRLNAPVMKVKDGKIASLDGSFSAIMCQTQFPGMEKIKQSRIVSVQYSMSKERHQYGAWRAMCDLNLVYGAYSAARIAPISPCVEIGNPRFDRWFSDTLDSEGIQKAKSLLDPGKKTILYLPTWGNLSSIPHFATALAGLARKYNVIVKVHHNTDAREQGKTVFLDELGIRNLFGANDDLLYLMHAADVILSDFSGAIFDAINVGKPVILLQKDPEALVGTENFGLESAEYACRDRIGPVVSSPDKLSETVERVLAGSIDFHERNALFRQECFARQQGCGKAGAEALRALVEKGIDRPPYQLYVRDMIADLRREVDRKAKMGGIKKVLLKEIKSAHNGFRQKIGLLKRS